MHIMATTTNTFKTSLSDLTDKNISDICSFCRQKGLKVHQQKNWLVMEGTSSESADVAKYIQSQAKKMRAANRKAVSATQSKTSAARASNTNGAASKSTGATAPTPKAPSPSVQISRTPTLKSFLTPVANAEQRMAQYLDYIRTLSASPTVTNATLANILDVAYATQYQIAVAAKGEQAIAENTVLKALGAARNNIHTTTASLEATVSRNLTQMKQAQKAFNTTKNALNEKAYLTARNNYIKAAKTLESARLEGSINALTKITRNLSAVAQVKQVVPMAANISGAVLPETTAGIAQATSASTAATTSTAVPSAISQSKEIILDLSKVPTEEIGSTLKMLDNAGIKPYDLDLYGRGPIDNYAINAKEFEILKSKPKLMSKLTKAGVKISVPQASATVGLEAAATIKKGAAIARIKNVARGSAVTAALSAAIDPDGTSGFGDDLIHGRIGKIWDETKSAVTAVGELGVKAVKNPKKALETAGEIAQDAYQSSATYVKENSLKEMAMDAGEGVWQGFLNIGETTINIAGSAADVTIQPLIKNVGEYLDSRSKYEYTQIKYDELSRDPFGFIINSVVSTDTKTGLRGDDTLFSIIDDNRIAAATALLKQKIDINVREPSSNGTGETALMYAITKNCPQIAFQILQDRRTDINARLPNGESALAVALLHNAPDKEEMSDDYFVASDLSKEQQILAYNHSLLISKMIADERLDLNQKDTLGRNLFMNAAVYSNLAALEQLRQRGVSINHTDKQGQNALHVSVEDPVITRVLLDMGVSHSQRDKSGKTPLMAALDVNRQSKDKNDRVVSLLINASNKAELEYVRSQLKYADLLNEWLAHHKEETPNPLNEVKQEPSQTLEDSATQESQTTDNSTKSESSQTGDQTTAETDIQNTLSLLKKLPQHQSTDSATTSHAQNNESSEKAAQLEDTANKPIWKRVKLPNYEWDLAPFEPGQWIYARAERAIYDADELVRQAGLDVPEQGSLDYAIETGSLDAQKMTGEDIYQLALSQYQKAKQAYTAAGKEMPAYNYPEIIEAAEQKEVKAKAAKENEQPAPSTSSNSQEEVKQAPEEKMIALPNETPEETKERYEMYRKLEYNRSVYNKIIQAYQENAAMDEKINSSYNFKEELAKKEAHLNQISEEVKQAISEGYDVNFATQEQGFAPLAHFATAHNDLSSLKLLQEAGANLNLTDNNGQTTAHKAIGKEMINYLAQNNVNLNQQDKNGMTPLIHIVSTHNRPYDYKTRQYIDTIEPLIRAGANIDMKDNAGKTVYDYADAMDMRLIRLTEQQMREEYQTKAANNDLDEETKQIIEHVKQQKIEQEKQQQLARQLATEEAARREQLAQQKAEKKAESAQAETTATETISPAQNIQEITIRHQYGETEEQHKKVLTHAITRNKRIKSKQRATALNNIRQMEELGLVAKGPNGESNADIYLYKIFQTTKLLTADSELHLDLDLDGNVDKIQAGELLSSTDGKSHKQIYKALTTKNLSEEELYKLVDTINNAEILINDRGEVISDIPQSVGKNKRRMIAKTQIYEIEEPLLQNEIAFNPGEDTTSEEPEGTEGINESSLKSRLGKAQKDTDDISSDTVAHTHLSEKLNDAQTHLLTDSDVIPTPTANKNRSS